MRQLLGGRRERNPAAEQRICGRSRAQYALHQSRSRKSARSPVMRVFPLTTMTSSPAMRPRLIPTPITSRAGTIGSSSMYIRMQA